MQNLIKRDRRKKHELAIFYYQIQNGIHRENEINTRTCTERKRDCELTEEKDEEEEERDTETQHKI